MKNRYTPPKPAKVGIRPEANIAGLFSFKFAEGTHIRLQDRTFVFKPERLDEHPSEVARMAHAGLKAADIAQHLAAINTLVAANEARHGFAVDYMFQEVKKDPEAFFAQKSVLEREVDEELADLALYYVVRAVNFKDATAQEAFMDALNAFSIVEHVQPAVVTSGADRTPTPDVSSRQRYLNAAPVGIDARYAWAFPGGTGHNVKVIDVEYDWVTDHEDFPRNRVWGGRPIAPYVRVGSEHGTAVMGVLAAPRDSRGVCGIVPDVGVGLSSVFDAAGLLAGGVIGTFSGESLAGRAHNVAVAVALFHPLSALGRDDVLLIEQHTFGPSSGRPCAIPDCSQWEFVPMEFYQETFDVVRFATARDITVVEAAGNGGMDLDAARYGGRFDRSLRDSGAVLVGASMAGDRFPAAFTNSGSRVDVHAWGAGVVTIGYGDGPRAPFPFNGTEIPRFYTQGFGGTSSASPMVAGAVASIQAARLAAGRPALAPRDMRDLLVRTGTPQRPAAGRPIGPQPNLRAALDSAVPRPRVRLDTSQPAAVCLLDGGIHKLYSFVPSVGGRLSVCFHDADTWRWADQGTPAGSSVASAVGATTYRGRSIYAFLRGADGHLHVNYWTGSGWQWADQGLPAGTSVASAPSAVEFRTGIYAFVRGQDGHLHVNYWTDAWHWSDEGTPPSTTVAFRPAVTTVQPDEETTWLYAFTSGSNGRLYSKHWNGSRWTWTDHGGPPGTTVASAPSAVSYRTNRLHVFVIGANGHLYVCHGSAGGTMVWADLLAPPGAAPIGSLSTVVHGEQIHVFVRGTDRHLYVLYWDGASWIWADQGEPSMAAVASDPAAVIRPGGDYFVFATATGGVHFARQWEGAMWLWNYLGAPLPA